MMPFQEGDRVYIIENNLRVSPCTVCSTSGDMCVIRFDKGGVIRVRKSRLYRTAEETGFPVAGAVTPKPNNDRVIEEKAVTRKERTPWDWEFF